MHSLSSIVAVTLKAGPKTRIDAVLRQDAEQPSHALYLKPGAQWSVATGLWFVWSLAKKDKENRACQEAHSHAHIIQFDGLAYLFIFWDKMCGLHLTYFKSEIQTEGLFLDASEA